MRTDLIEYKVLPKQTKDAILLIRLSAMLNSITTIHTRNFNRLIRLRVVSCILK